MRADCHYGVELTGRFGFQHILDFTIENDLDAGTRRFSKCRISAKRIRARLSVEISS